MPTRATHTFALLQLSTAAFIEIRDKLRAAGYDHCFHHDGHVIDLHGLGICEADPDNLPETKDEHRGRRQKGNAEENTAAEETGS
jgi:hypothetical protein